MKVEIWFVIALGKNGISPENGLFFQRRCKYSQKGRAASGWLLFLQAPVDFFNVTQNVVPSGAVL